MAYRTTVIRQNDGQAVILLMPATSKWTQMNSLQNTERPAELKKKLIKKER